MANIVKLGPEYFPLSDKGKPISNGYIYVGNADTDPEIPGNQKQISVLQEDNSIVPVAQPLRTSAGGVPVYSGSPVTILVDGEYSLKVNDSTGSQVYYIPRSFFPDTKTYISSYNGDLPAAVADIGSTETILVINEDLDTLQANLTIPDNIVMEWWYPYDIRDDANNANLTINGEIIAGAWQIFDWGNGSGTITFKNGTIVQQAWHGSFAEAVSDIDSSSNVEVVISESESIAANLTVGDNITSNFINKAILSDTVAGADLVFNGSIKAPEDQQIFNWGTGAGSVTINGFNVYPDWFTENATPGTTDMTDALNNAVESGCKNVVLSGIYSYSGITIPSATSNLSIKGSGSGGATELRYTEATGNGIDFAGEADNLTISNLLMSSPSNSTGWAIRANTGSGVALRNTILENVYIDGFLNGVNIRFSVNILIRGGNQTGQGIGSGGVAYQIGEDVTDSNNMTVFEKVYTTNYGTGIYSKYSTTMHIYDSIIGVCTTGVLPSAGVLYMTNCYFESNTTAIDNTANANVSGGWVLTGSGNAVIPGSIHRFNRGGYQAIKTVALLTSWALTGGPTIIPFDTEEEDTESAFVIGANARQLIPYDGFYKVSLIVTFSPTASGQWISADLYNGTAQIPGTSVHNQSSGTSPLSVTVDRLVWLTTTDQLSGRASTSAAMNLVSACMSINAIGF